MFPLFNHQQQGLDWLQRRGGSGAIFWEPGTGKTRLCLENFIRLRATTPTLRLLVICPKSTIEAVWGEEIQKATTLTWTTLKHLNPTADCWIGNFESVIRPAMQHRLDVAGLWRTPLLLVVDESSRCKDPRSLTTKTLLAFAERCQHRICCSGTPTPNSMAELWGQIRIIAPEVFHKSYFAWRREYFFLGRNGRTLSDPPPSRQAMQSLFQSGWKYDITPEKRDQLLARIAPITSWVKKRDCLDLPERITQIRHVTLGVEEQKAYNLMKQQLVVEFKNEVVTAEIALTKLMKLRQLSSGFLYGNTTHKIGTSRLNVLKETLEELGEQNVIIWANFHEEIEQIAALLGDQAVTLYAKTKDRNESLKRFGTDARYLIAHPRSAGHGLTLTQASTCVWFSLDWSLEAYSQANDRIHRIGQTRSCLYVHLIAPGLIDEDIWAVLQKKQTLQEAIDRILGGRSATPHRDLPQAALADGVGVRPG